MGAFVKHNPSLGGCCRARKADLAVAGTPLREEKKQRPTPGDRLKRPSCMTLCMERRLNRARLSLMGTVIF